MPLFKKHHDAPVDSTSNYQTGTVNDPAYNAGVNAPNSAGYPSDQGAYAGAPHGNTAHPSGVGAPLDNSYEHQTATHGHPGAATAGGAALGAGAGHELGGHAGPGAAVGGIAGNHTSHQHNQPTSGYNDGYAGQPGAMNTNTTSHHPVRNEVGGAALGAETGHHMGNHAGAGAAAGGLAGREEAHHHAGTNAAGVGGVGVNEGVASSRELKNLEMKGKAQQLAGMVLSSQTMKAKGLAKEQEAVALRHQGENLQQAEHHEAAARLARERAAHGAHPQHGELGGARTY